MLDMGDFLNVFCAGPELDSCLPQDQVATTVQSLYIFTGCDCVLR